MSKKRKQKLTPWSLGSLPITPVAVKNENAPEDRATLLKRLKDEEEQRRLANDPVHVAIVTQSKAVSELRKLTIEFWSRPIADILADGKKCEAGKDVTFSVPALRDEYTQQDAERAFWGWHNTTFSKSGYELTEQGAQRLVRFGIIQALAGADMSNADAWQAAFEHLKNNLQIFQPGDFSKEPRPVAAPAPKPTLDDIETLPDADAKRVVRDLMFAQGSPLHQEWMYSLYRNFNGFVPTREDIDYIYIEMFPRNNWSYVDRRSFDKARRAMVAQLRWPESLLTEDERLCKELDALETSNMSFDERQALRAKLLRQRQN